MHTRNSIALLLVHIGSCVLLLAAGVSGVGNPVDNIDVLEPIVRISPARRDSSSRDDLFGWAAIMHQIETVNPSDTIEQAAQKTRIIVGAPRGTFPGGLTQYEDLGATRLAQTGLVYNCPVQPGTCDGIRGDTTRYLNNPAALDNNGSLDTIPNLRTYPQAYIEGRLFDQAPNARLYNLEDRAFLPAENKTGQLLGATLFSNGDRFIACAPRWTDTRTSFYQLLPRGICYVGSRSLTGFERLQPCNSASGISARTESDGYCLAGTSVLIYDNSFILGAPDDDTGRGSLYYSNDISSNAMFTKSNSFVQNATTGMNVTSITDQYQGFSTVSAFITTMRGSNPPPNIVTTVPRFNDDTYMGRVNVYTPPDYMNIIQSVNAEGTQMAEFFGHSLIAIDINGDDYDDLVVGAPMNTDFNALKVERGRVYVFMNDGAGALGRPLMFNGTTPRGRFGTSLAKLGDINQDGFEDFVVGAPYTDDGSNSGAIYIYYGNSDIDAFKIQVPFEITASDVVNNVTTLTELKTFGFSLSSGIDVDNNQYNDLVVGAYEDQTVVLFRTLPVVTVTVGISAPTMVELNSSFSVNVTAYYQGVGVNGRIDVPFVLSEEPSASRLRFANGGRGTFTIMGSGSAMMNTQTVVVTSLGNTTSLDDHMLQLNIEDVVRSVTPSDGNQPLTDLSSFPRLLQNGMSTAAVAIRDPCNNDGCQFNVRLSQPSNNITVTAGGGIVHTVEFQYENLGVEDAVGLRLNFTNLLGFIRSVAIKRQDAGPSLTRCDPVSNGVTSCSLRARINPGESESVTVNFTVDQEVIVGNENDFNVNLEIVSMTDNRLDNDTDPNDNTQQVGFSINATADISVGGLSFGGSRFDYTAIRPSTDTTTSLGRSVTLEVDIRNSGPSTIREGQVIIYLANRIGENSFTLYPTRLPNITNNANGEILCQPGIVNPEGLPDGSPQVSGSRRRRSASQSGFSSLKRVTRQENPANTEMNSCIGPTVDSATCTTIRCNITNFKPGTITVAIFTRIDERYFSSQPVADTEYTLTTSANVSVMGSFYGDDPSDNSGQVTIVLGPMAVEPPGESDRNLLHFILWPCIGGILLLILAAVLLYFVGFFRRKRKPEEGEIEGDFDPDKFKMQPQPEDGEKPSAPEGVDAPSEITKV